MSKKNTKEIQTRDSASAAEIHSDSSFTAKQVDSAFEYYYKLGVGRSALAVAKNLHIPFETIAEWKSLYAWDEKTKDRDADIYAATERLYVDKSRKIRNRLIGQVDRLLDEVDRCSMGLPFAINDVDDLRKLSQAYKMLVEANALAMVSGKDVLAEDSPMSWAELIQKFSGIPDAAHSEDEFKDI